MRLVAVGINHKTAPVEIRERVSFPVSEIIEADCFLKKEFSFKEALVLNTCNRLEIYVAVDKASKNYLDNIKFFISQKRNINLPDFENRLYIYENKEAVAHLFRVASGLDSMVIGETEILGQVKKSYEDARTAGSVAKVLSRLFEKAFNTAKKIRTDTFITRGSVSVSSTAVRLAEKILGRMTDKKVLVVGAGIVGEQLVVSLKENGVKSISVANRTLEKANTLALKLGATAINFEDFKNALTETDMVITSTGAPHYIINRDEILHLMQRRGQKPVFFIDLAVPRDIDPQVNRIDNVYLYDIDDLQKIVDDNILLRKNELDNCNRIVEESSIRFMEWMNKEDIVKNVSQKDGVCLSSS